MGPTPFSCERDGLTLRGLVFGSAEPGRPKPAVVLCHGFLANQRMCRDYARLLADMGHVCFTFDFAGGGLGSKSDGDPEDMTVFTEVADLMAVLGHVKARPGIRSREVAVLGCSQGGFVAALAAARHPEAVARLVLLYPAFCIPDDARSGHMMFYKFDPADIPDTLGRIPMRLGGDYARSVVGMDVASEVAGYDGPVLYLQGTADRIVDVRYGRELHRVWPDCEYVEIEGGGHMFRGAAEAEAERLVADFMRRDPR